MAKAPQTVPVETVMAGFPGEMISVRGPEAGRRRAGISFGKEAVLVDLGTITPEQYQAILDDPTLSVVAVKALTGAAPAPAPSN